MFNHGMAKCIRTIKDGTITKDEVGVITAYLPDMERFAVWFDNKRWITFQWNESEFLEHFEVID